MHRLTEKDVLQRFKAFRKARPWMQKEGYTINLFEADRVDAHRPPTPAEIRFGYGATHYKEFPLVVWVHPKTGRLKRWIKCEFDGLRYYR